MRDNNEEKRGLHRVIMGVILFLIVFLFSALLVDEDKENTKKTEEEIATYGEVTPEDVKIRVVIDPGHGGNDPGKVSSEGILEKDLNLQIALKLESELKVCGIESYILRTEDRNLATEGATNKKNSDMKNRVAVINEMNPDILISIHQNSFSDPKVRGPQVFYNSTSQASEEYALLLQDKLNTINPDCSRKAKSDNQLYMLDKSICPAVIVECGFLSSPEDVAILSDESYQYELADTIAASVEEWLEH